MSCELWTALSGKWQSYEQKGRESKEKKKRADSVLLLQSALLLCICRKTLYLEAMNKQPAPQLRLKPGRFRRH